MSFKDLTARAAAAMKLKLAQTNVTTRTPAKDNEAKAVGKDAPEKPKTS